MLDIFVLAAETPPLTMAMRIPLSIMNFLEFAIWGAWFVVLGQYLNALKFNGKQIGSIYATMSLGMFLSPMFIGAIADRYFNAEHLLGVMHLVGAVLLFWMSQARTARMFYFAALLYALAYAPTISLANTVMFTHCDGARDAPSLRVWGTIGWIVANLFLKVLLKANEPVNNRPLKLASILSVVFGIYAFFLPATPPQSKAETLPFLDALKLLDNRAFAVFFGVSFLITIALAYYYSFTSLFLEQKVGVKSDNVGPLMTIGQFAEIVFMLLLPWFLAEFGIKWVLVMGMSAWVLRYALFSAGRPFPLVLLGLALHGICYDFFFQAGFIYVDGQAPADIKNSAQSLFVALTYGIGMYLGTEASGWTHFLYTKTTEDPATGQTTTTTNWRSFWLLPCIVALVCLIGFVLAF